MTTDQAQIGKTLFLRSKLELPVSDRSKVSKAGLNYLPGVRALFTVQVGHLLQLASFPPQTYIGKPLSTPQVVKYVTSLQAPPICIHEFVR